MNKFTRKQLLNMYRDRRRQDGKKVGSRIRDLTSSLMLFSDAKKVSRNSECSCGTNKKYKKCCGLKPKIRVDPKSPEVQETFQELVAIRKVNRFRDDFPSFAKFKKFLKDEDVSFKEAMEA